MVHLLFLALAVVVLFQAWRMWRAMPTLRRDPIAARRSGVLLLATFATFVLVGISSLQAS